MKRLGVFVAIITLSISLFGGFLSPNTANALLTEKTLDTYRSQGDTIFQTELTNLNNKRANPGAVKATETTTAILGTTVDVVDALIDAVSASYETFKSTLNSGSGTNSARYEGALTAAGRTIQDKRTQDRGPLRKPYAVNVLNFFQRQLDDEAAADRKFISLQQAGYSAADAQKSADILASARKDASASVAAGATESKYKGECSFGILGNMNLPACLSEGVTWIIKNTLLQIAGWLLWLAANMFNYSMQIGVLRFSEWAPDTLYPIWMIIRQIVSLIVVFVGLYLGFLYILGREDKFEKYIPWVVMFALFVNFSYPLARTAIDISNIISLNLYTSAVGNNALAAEITSQDTAGAIIVSRLGLQGLASSATAGDAAGAATGMMTSINSIPGALMAVVFVLYAAYIFFMVTGIIVMRTAALIFLTIASPFLLVDSVLPMLGDKAQQIRKIFFEQLIVGPVFMVMLALTLKFLEVFSTAGKLGGNIGAAGGNGVDTITTFFNILMMLIMLHIMITVTKKVSGELGNYATNAMGKVGGFGLGAASAGTGMLARQSIGRAANAVRDSKWMERNQDSFVGSRMYDLTNSVSNSTFDLRNSNVVAGKMNKLGMGMGMGTKMGFEKGMEAKKVNLQERMQRIKTRYERDEYKLDSRGEIMRDENNQPVLLHKKGDIDVKGQQALDRFVSTAGGSRFLTKGEKEKFRTQFGSEVDKKEEKRINDIKGRSSQGFKDYTNIEEERKMNRETGEVTLISKEQGQANFLEQLKREKDNLKKTDPSLRGERAQEVVSTINSIEKKIEEDKLEKYNAITNDFDASGKKITKQEGQAAFISKLDKELSELEKTDPNLESTKAEAMIKTLREIKKKQEKDTKQLERQIFEAFDKYNRIDDPVQKAKHLNNLPDDIEAGVRRMVAGKPAVERIETPAVDAVEDEDTEHIDFDNLPPAPLTGKDLRAERIQRVATGRQAMVSQAEQKMVDSGDTVEGGKIQDREINEKYDNKLADLQRSREDSLILDSRGVPVKKPVPQELINKVEQERQKELADANEYSAEFAEDYQTNVAELQKKTSKQEASAGRVGKFSENRNTTSVAERLAARRAQKQGLPIPSQQTTPSLTSEEISARREQRQAAAMNEINTQAPSTSSPTITIPSATQSQSSQPLTTEQITARRVERQAQAAEQLNTPRTPSPTLVIPTAGGGTGSINPVNENAARAALEAIRAKAAKVDITGKTKDSSNETPYTQSA